MTTLIIIFLCSYLAFSLSAVCGGGAGLMLIPILGNLLPIGQVPAALSIGTLTSSASRIAIFYRSISWGIVKYFVPAALPGVFLGAWLLKYLNPLYIGLILGLFMASNLSAVFKKAKDLKQSRSTPTSLLLAIGFLAGSLSGLTGAVGLLFNKFYLRHGLNKEEIVATRAANEVILHLIKIVLYLIFGLITFHVMTIGIVVAVSAVLSSVTMKWVLPLLSEILFKKVGYLAMALSGFFMLFQSGDNLLSANKGTLSTSFISEGVEAKLQWQQANYALEFTYDDGFEFEQEIPLTDLTPQQQQIVNNQKGIADQIIVENVYCVGPHYHEVYFLKDKRVLRKTEF